MSIRSLRDLDGLARVGRLVASLRDAIAREVRPGVTTGALDRRAAAFLAAAAPGARPAPRVEYGFPGTVLLSVNDEAVHGVPGPRTIRPGDVVKVDVTLELDGYVADAAVTVAVEPVSSAVRNLCDGTHAALERALEAARAGEPISAIGAAVEREASRRGLSVIRAVCGHGVGRRIHEPPAVPNHFDPSLRGVLTEGLVLAIEPILAAGAGDVVKGADGWTIRTADGSPAAHREHTVVIARGRPIVLTAA